MNTEQKNYDGRLEGEDVYVNVKKERKAEGDDRLCACSCGKTVGTVGE